MASFIYGILLTLLVLQISPWFSVNATQCFEFTWLRSNKTIHNCNKTLLDSSGKPQPCRRALNFTNDGQPPNLTELVKDSTYRCTSPTEQCLRYTWSDVSGNSENYTLFCGKVIDVTDPSKSGGKALSNGCWEEKVSTYKREVCVCDGNFCNGSASLSTAALVAAMVFFTSLVVLRHSSGYLQ